MWSQDSRPGRLALEPTLRMPLLHATRSTYGMVLFLFKPMRVVWLEISEYVDCLFYLWVIFLGKKIFIEPFLYIAHKLRNNKIIKVKEGQSASFSSLSLLLSPAVPKATWLFLLGRPQRCDLHSVPRLLPGSHCTRTWGGKPALL